MLRKVNSITFVFSQYFSCQTCCRQGALQSLNALPNEQHSPSTCFCDSQTSLFTFPDITKSFSLNEKEGNANQSFQFRSAGVNRKLQTGLNMAALDKTERALKWFYCISLGGIHGTVVVRGTAGQQVERSILRQGYDS